MNCASCSTPLPDTALFCPGCGQRISGQRLSAPAPPPAPVPAPAPSRRRAAPLIARDELSAVVAARQELGERMEPEILDAFLERVENAVERRLDTRVEEQVRRARLTAGGRAQHLTGRIAASLGLGIPLTVLSAEKAGPVGLIAVWLSIIVLNIYYTEAERRR